MKSSTRQRGSLRKGFRWLVPWTTWLSAVVGYAGYDATSGSFDFLPAGADFFLLGALVAYSGMGGAGNIVLANWARDKGYGMGQRAGYIPAAVGGDRVHLAHVGFTFEGDGGGASSARTSGASSSSAPCSACCSPRCST